MELRPGIAVPDWSVLTDPVGRAALAASMAVAGRRRRWSSLDAAEDGMRRAVLRHFVEQGSGPSVQAMARATTGDGSTALTLLRRLRERDLLVLDAAETVVAACYPFSSKATPHLVLLADGRAPLRALCAVDALGAGGMLRADATIRSRCGHCGTAVIARTCEAGTRLASAQPETAMVWTGIRYAGGCAATSGCALKLFFCSPNHLEAWRAGADPGGPGFRLPLPVALQVGLALFGPMLPRGA